MYDSFWFGFSCTKTDSVCRNNFPTHHGLILLYYFHQRILNKKTKFLKKYNFFGQAWFLPPGNQVFAYRTYIFPSCDIMNYLYIWYISICLHNLCMNCSSLDHVSWTREISIEQSKSDLRKTSKCRSLENFLF